MARFNYVARGSDGDRVTGTQDAQDAKALAASLRSKGFVPISVDEDTPKEVFSDQATRRKRGRVKQIDVAEFVRQLSVLLDASVGLVTALEDLAAQEEKEEFNRVLEDVRNKVMGGNPLSSSLKDHPRVFSPLLCAMAKAGEETGQLEGVLADLASYLESAIALKRKVKTACTYPAFVGVVFSGAVGFMFLVLLPKFEAIFSSLGRGLPLLTQLALGFSVWLKHWFPLFIPLGIAAVLGTHLASRTERGRMFLHSLLLRMPLAGQLIMQISLARFLATLATLQRSGVPILTSIDIAADTVGNTMIEAELRAAREGLMKGSFLSRELARGGLFPRMMIRMIAVGEQTGKMEELLARTAAYYRAEAEAGIQRMTALIEPLIMVLMGIVVGFVVFAVYMPIFQIAGAVH